MDLGLNIGISLAIVAFGFLMGSIPTGVIIGKLFFHDDPRNYGSHNPGGTNTGRAFGKKIGITGVSPRLAGLVAHVNYGNAKYIKPSEAVNKVTKYLHDVKKCDVIICISHLGWDILGSDNKEFIPETHYIDYVVGGHSHTYFTEPLYVKDADGKEVPDFQMGKSGRWVAKSVLEVE